MNQQQTQLLTNLVGSKKSSKRSRKNKHLVWKKVDHPKLIRIVRNAKHYACFEYPLLSVPEANRPLLVHEQNCIRNSFWLTESQFFKGQTYLRLFGIATALLVYAHDEGAKRIHAIKLIPNTTVNWSQLCQRYYQGLFVTIIFVFEKGPWAQGQEWFETLEKRHLRNDLYWQYFVPALLNFCRGLFAPGLFDPYFAWHNETPQMLVSREKRRVQSGIYSLSGYQNYLDRFQFMDKVDVKFLNGAYYPFLRILQCLHNCCDSIHEHPNFDNFWITDDQKYRLEHKTSIYVPWGLQMESCDEKSSGDDANGPPAKRRRLCVESQLSLEIQLMNGSEDAKVTNGKDAGHDQLVDIGIDDDN
jgi:hypothetical protein